MPLECFLVSGFGSAVTIDPVPAASIGVRVQFTLGSKHNLVNSKSCIPIHASTEKYVHMHAKNKDPDMVSRTGPLNTNAS